MENQIIVIRNQLINIDSNENEQDCDQSDQSRAHTPCFRTHKVNH